MWFDKKDINIVKPLINIKDLQGYVLPHAGTSHTSRIISHTLRFKPEMKFNRILILFYPANDVENITNINPPMYHEEYVVKEILLYTIKNIWKIERKIKFLSYNVRDEKKDINTEETLVVISADFSHYLPLQNAIKLENCAAQSIMYRRIYDDKDCLNIIDHVDSFKEMYKLLPKSMLQWIGRSRSLGKRGVGYLSFLIRKPAEPEKLSPNGIFITVYDNLMNTRECLGNWYDNDNKWSLMKESDFLEKVLQKARTTSRLTGGKFLENPITNYTITYLYLSKHKEFIRGYHGILGSAFYLPNVFLENTYENGTWIKYTDDKWKHKKGNFRLNETLKNLQAKSKNHITKKRVKKKNYTLYDTRVIHREVV